MPTPQLRGIVQSYSVKVIRNQIIISKTYLPNHKKTATFQESLTETFSYQWLMMTKCIYYIMYQLWVNLGIKASIPNQVDYPPLCFFRSHVQLFSKHTAIHISHTHTHLTNDRNLCQAHNQIPYVKCKAIKHSNGCTKVAPSGGQTPVWQTDTHAAGSSIAIVHI